MKLICDRGKNMWLLISSCVIIAVIVVRWAIIVATTLRDNQQQLLDEQQQHHDAMSESFQALVQIMVKLSGATMVPEGQDDVSMHCSYINQNDPDDIKCKNPNSTTGECEITNCPLLH